MWDFAMANPVCFTVILVLVPAVFMLGATMVVDAFVRLRKANQANIFDSMRSCFEKAEELKKAKGGS